MKSRYSLLIKVVGGLMILMAFGFASFATSSASKEIVFLDENVKDYEILRADLGKQYEAYTLSDQQSGLTQIMEVLKSQEKVKAIHIISHGDAGVLYLGSEAITEDKLAQYKNQLKTISGCFDIDADVYLYGCNVAETADGRSFVNALSSLLDVTVYASENLTGDASKGGDWSFEYVAKMGRGAVQSVHQSIFSDALKRAYIHTLLPKWVKETEILSANTSSPRGMLEDLDNDGDLDLLMYIDEADDLVYKNDGAGHFSYYDTIAVSRSFDYKLGDIDNDGDLDAFIYDAGNRLVHIWKNDGTGAFSDAGTPFNDANSRPDIGDVDGDSDIDIVVVGDTAIKVYKNNGSGTFSLSNTKTLDLGGNMMGAVLLDIDGDTDLDLYVSGEDKGGIYKNNGSGVFSHHSYFGGKYVTNPSKGDVDSDGDIDVLVPGGEGSGTKTFYLNNLDGTYSTKASTFSRIYEHFYLIWMVMVIMTMRTLRIYTRIMQVNFL